MLTCDPVRRPSISGGGPVQECPAPMSQSPLGGRPDGGEPGHSSCQPAGPVWRCGTHLLLPGPAWPRGDLCCGLADLFGELLDLGGGAGLTLGVELGGDRLGKATASSRPATSSARSADSWSLSRSNEGLNVTSRRSTTKCHERRSKAHPVLSDPAELRTSEQLRQ